MECFNGTLKVEALYNPVLTQDRPSFKAQNDLIGRYVEFYNNERLKWYGFFGHISGSKPCNAVTFYTRCCLQK